MNRIKKRVKTIGKRLGMRRSEKAGSWEAGGSQISKEGEKENSRRDFFKKGMLTALAVGGFSQLRNKANGEVLSAAGGKAALTGLGIGGPATGEGGDFAEVFEDIKRDATAEELFRFLYAVPKGGDLHHHHGGATLQENWYQVATDPSLNGGQRYYTRHRIENCPEFKIPKRRSGSNSMLYWINIHERAWKSLPECNRKEFKPVEELNEEERKSWMSSIVLDRPGEGRDEFFEKTWSRINHLFKNPHVMSELLVENMKLMGREGVIYMEPQVGVKGFENERGGSLSADDVYGIYKNRLNRPDALATGVTVRCLLTILRFRKDAPSHVEPSFDFIYKHRDLWRGLNMAGREDNQKGYPARFTEAYDNALRKYPGVGISIHAGEQDEPSTHIFDTLRLGATRIGHGVNLIDDAETMQLMRMGKFMVEINLVSNHLLEYVDDPKDHPFPIYMRQGIPCALSTDDRGMWDSNMTDEYYSAVTNFNLCWEELVGLGRNSLKFSFAQPAVKSELLKRYDQKIDDFERKYAAGNWRKHLKKVKAVTYGYGRRQYGLKLGTV